MSSFFVFRRRRYAVIVADSLALSQPGASGYASRLFSKVFQVAPHLYATAAGDATIYLRALNDFARVPYKELEDAGAENVASQFASRLKGAYENAMVAYGQDPQSRHHDVRVCLLFSVPITHPADRAEGWSTSLYIVETARQFRPERVSGAWCVPSEELNKVLRVILGHPSMIKLMDRGAIFMAQVLIATHAFSSQLLHRSSQEPNVVAVAEDGHTVLTGYMTNLPARHLIVAAEAISENVAEPS